MWAKLNSIEGRWKRCFAFLAFFTFWWFLFRGILQFFCFQYATMGCGAGELQDYTYPGGGWTCPPNVDTNDLPHHGQETSDWPIAKGPRYNCTRTPEDNAVPGGHMLMEEPASMFGQEFQLSRAPSGSISPTEAPVGSWWRVWGPWFWTYTYQDMSHSKTTLYMRPTIVGMMGIYSETRIMRCDGEGDVWFFGEGSGWVYNRIRTLFRMQRESAFKIYRGDDRVGTAKETFHGSKSISFSTYPEDDPTSSSFLTRYQQTDYPMDLWIHHKERNVDIRRQLPNYVASAATVLMAFRWRSIRRADGHTSANTRNAPAPPPQYFLAETSNASVAYFEETGETVGDQETEALESGDEYGNAEANGVADGKTDA